MNWEQDKINRMEGKEDKKNRISRIKLRNIANPNYYKSVTERNNLFSKVKKNTAVLSKMQNVEDHFHELFEASEKKHCESTNEITSKKLSVREVRGSRRYSIANHSIGSGSSHSKRYSQLPSLQTNKSKELSVPSAKAFEETQNQSKNSIEGTQLGVMSTKEILKKYEIKKLTEEMSKKKFLDDYIRNLKNGGFQIDDQADDSSIDHLTEPKNNSHGDHHSRKLPLSQSATQSVRTKDKNLSENQEKLTNLLENRLSDRDFIDFNVKLFEKRDVNKKKFFQKYHNILKQQRASIVNR